MKSDWYKKDLILLGEYVERYIDDHTLNIHNMEAFAKACFEAFVDCCDDPSYEKFEQNMCNFPSITYPALEAKKESMKSFLGMPYEFTE